MPIKRLPNGRYQATYSNRRRGVKRTRRTFNTRKQANEWLKAIDSGVHNRLMGHPQRRLFGHALAKFLKGESKQNDTHNNTLSNARALRWPIRHEGRWIVPAETVLDQKELVPVINSMAIDHAAILGSRRLQNRHNYHLRYNADSVPTWYYQPDNGIRKEVSDPALIDRLNQAEVSPISKHTIRLRLALVKRVISVAYQQYRWVDSNFGDQIQMPKNLPSRNITISDDQFQELLDVADDAHGDLYTALLEIGWRMAKIVSLEWDRVHFPVYQTNTAGQTIKVQHGYLEAKTQTSNKRVPPMPMTNRVEQLLKKRWEQRVSNAESRAGYVFHRGDGSPFKSFHKQWRKDLAQTSINPKFTRHGFRHTWATNFGRRGGTALQLQHLTGWTLQTCQKYVHLTAAQIAEAYLEITDQPIGVNHEQINNRPQ